MSNKVRAKGPRRPAPAPRSPFAKPRRGPATETAPFGFGFQQWGVIVAAAGAQVLVLTNSADPVNVPKLTLVLLVAIAVLAVGAARGAARRAVTVPMDASTWAAVAFGVAAVISTAVAPATGIALWGSYLRNAGLFLYLACLVLFAVSVRVGDEQFVRRLALSLLSVGGLLAFYSLLQRFDVDPIPWYKAYSNPVSTFGNPDFASAFYGIALPLAIWAVVWSGLTGVWRWSCALAAVLLAVGINIEGAAQGYVGAVVALFVLLLGWIITRPPDARRRGLLAWGVTAGVGVALLAAGLASAGPLARLGGTGAVDIRRHFWGVAATMFGHHPIAGVGMNMYGDYFRFYRSPSVVSALGAVDAPDAPHSVPVAMFANGGLLLGLSYLAFVVAVGVAFVRALRRGDDRGVMLTAAIGAAWAAFQVESTVSIDVVPLVTLHFVLAGAVVARSGLAMRTFALTRERPRAAAGTSLPLPLTAAIVAGGVLGWFAIQPLAADIHSSSAAKAAARGDAQGAFQQIEKATSEAPWQGVYWLQRSRYEGALGRYDAGLADLRRALDEDPRDVDAAVSLARVESALGNKEAAAHYYQVAIRLDPRNPELSDALRQLRGQ